MSIVTYNNRSIANISAVPGAAKSLTLIKTLTASSSSTLSFVDGSNDVVLDNTYPIYKFEFINIHPATDNVSFSFNLSTDGGSNYNVTKTTTYFYAYLAENNDYGILEYVAGLDLAQSTSDQPLSNNVGNDNDQSASGELFLFNPSSTTFVKHFMSTTNQYDRADISVNPRMAGYGNTTSAIDGVRFQMSSGNIDAGTIKLYGLKDS